jgi:peroxiredoxin (alkyl hydroperoxide reductase subunit C)
VLFWYPKDFTFVCPTEIIAFSDRAKEFDAIDCQVIAASTDTEECHLAWIKTPRNRGGLGYMQITINDLPIGRSVDETLRLVQAIQFHAKYGEVCPANWKPGDKTIVADPEKSLEYFESANKEAAGASDEFGANLTPIKSRRDFEQLIKGDKPVVVDFMAGWCGKCRMIAPFVDELAEKHPGLVFAKFDTSEEKLEPLSAELQVKALPVFKFYKDGQEVVQQVVGYKKKPLEAAVEQLAAMK